MELEFAELIGETFHLALVLIIQLNWLFDRKERIHARLCESHVHCNWHLLDNWRRYECYRQHYHHVPSSGSSTGLTSLHCHFHFTCNLPGHRYIHTGHWLTCMGHKCTPYEKSFSLTKAVLLGGTGVVVRRNCMVHHS